MKKGIINNHQAALAWLSLLSAILLLLFSVSAHSQDGSISDRLTIETNQAMATGGYFRLSWALDNRGNVEQPHYIVQQATEPAFTQAKTLYEGGDHSALISGLADGDYYYRIGLQGEPGWSESVHVEVKHHSLSTATRFFLLGLLVFLLTLGTILYGIKQTRQAQ